MRKLLLQIILIMAVIALPGACKKKETCESCYEIFDKSECSESEVCVWESNYVGQMIQYNPYNYQYGVSDQGRCRCEQEQPAEIVKSSRVVYTDVITNAFITKTAADLSNKVWVSYNSLTRYYVGTTPTSQDIRPFDNVSVSSPPYFTRPVTATGFSVTPGNILYASLGNYGLASINSTTPLQWDYYQTLNAAMPTQKLNDVCAESDNVIWLATNDKGLMKFELPDTWTIYTTSNSNIPANLIKCLTRDTSGNVWMGTNGSVARFKNGSFLTLGLEEVKDIACDGSNNIWAATLSGLFRITTSNNSLYKFTTENSGLTSNGIYCLAVDLDGKLFIGTSDGLFAYESNQIVKLIPSDDEWTGVFSLCVDQNNSLYIGGGSSLSRMDQ